MRDHGRAIDLIAGATDCRFRPVPRTDRGLPDGTYRTDDGFAGTLALALALALAHARARARARA